MTESGVLARFRDALAIVVVLLFLFPIAWWSLMSVMPPSAIFNKDGVVLFAFTPTFENYRLVAGNDGPDAFSVRAAFIDSTIIAMGSTALTLVIGLMAAFALSRLGMRSIGAWLWGTLFFRFIPPVAVVIPVALFFHQVLLFDTHVGVMLMHAVFNLPIAVLMLRSFLAEVPQEVDDAARIDGATALQILVRILVPQIRGGIAATAIICFLFSWTEFLMALFLTVSFRTLPIKLSILSMGDWGALAAAGTAAMVPGFIFILLVQRHLVRGLTLGSQR